MGEEVLERGFLFILSTIQINRDTTHGIHEGA